MRRRRGWFFWLQPPLPTHVVFFDRAPSYFLLPHDMTMRRRQHDDEEEARSPLSLFCFIFGNDNKEVEKHKEGLKSNNFV